jgi:hypothetical protein
MQIHTHVRGAHERDLARREAERLRRAGFHQGQRLEGLGRGAQERHNLRIAKGGHEPPKRVRHGDGTVMQGLDDVAAREF